jgi:predicted nucleic acid-binding protein
VIVYVDSGVLIAAFRGDPEVARPAFEILDDRHTEFASSIFVKLELLPKAAYNGFAVETRFYQAFFARVAHWATPTEVLLDQALDLARNHGLSAMDALHLAAARSVSADELVTTELPTKPLFRAGGVKVRSIAAPNALR